MDNWVGLTSTRDLDITKANHRKVLYNSFETVCGIYGVDWKTVQGCCVGGDDAWSNFCWAMQIPVYGVIGQDRSRMAPNSEVVCRQIWEIPGPFKDRNQFIVDRSDILVGLPMYPEDHEYSKRSGTWQTIRMARKKGMPIYIWVLNDRGLVKQWVENGHNT